jgi:hypothetical protein
VKKRNSIEDLRRAMRDYEIARQDKLLQTVDDARRQLSMGRTRFYEEIRAGRIEVVHADARTLVPQSAINNYVALLIAEAKAVA